MSSRHDAGPMFFPPRNWSRRFGTQFFTIEIKEVRICEDQKTAEKHALYNIIVKRGKQERIVARRYSEFYEFHRLLVRFSSYARRCNFPPKTWFRNVSNSFLEERKELLDKYLQQILHDQRIARHKYTIAFLNLNNFELYKWWDFQARGLADNQTDIDPTLRVRHPNSKHNRKSRNAKLDESTKEGEFTFKNRSNSLFSANQSQSKQNTNTTDSTTVVHAQNNKKIRTPLLATVEPQPFQLPEADSNKMIQTGV